MITAMTTFLLIAMALLLFAALERSHRRNSPGAPGLSGSFDHEDRDWARTKLDLLALGDQAEPFTDEPIGVKRPERHSGAGSRPDPSRNGHAGTPTTATGQAQPDR